MPVKISHTVASVDDVAAGPSYSVPSLVNALNLLGHKAEVVALSRNGLSSSLGAPVRSFKPDVVWPLFLQRLGKSQEMSNYLMGCRADIFHGHGLWMMSTIYPAMAAHRLSKPLVVAPRGMLGKEALGFSKTLKRAFRLAIQDRAMKAVTCFHATAESEVEDIRNFGLRQPVAIVPNGIDLPKLSLSPNDNRSSSPYVLSLGRLHPKKALDRLISAFAANATKFPGWKLRIVGPSEGGYAEQLEKQTRSLGLGECISIEGPVFGNEKRKLMRDAELFVLPTLHENFAMTVAESLALKTPVISTIGAPWSGLVDHGCGWWVDHGVTPLANALREAMSMSCEERSAMGSQGREWMKRDFAWDGIAAKMEVLYLWLLGQHSKPDFVY